MFSKRIIFIVESTFNLRDFKRFGIEILMNRGFCVEIWDLTSILNSKYWQNYIVPDPISIPNYRIFNSKKEALGALIHLDSRKDSVITIFNPKREAVFVFNYLEKNRINFGFLVLGAVPFNRMHFSHLDRLKNIICRPSHLTKKIFHRLINLSVKKYRANFFIIGGNTDKIKAKQSLHYCETSKLVSTHSFDYDNFLEEKQTTIDLINGEKYIVMLDEYNLFHPDNVQSGMPVNPKTYYKDLNNFFSNIEFFFGMPVIIAEHPRSESEKMKNSYGGRKRVNGKTLQLIMNAELVLAHASTALNYAVLCKKPVVFLTSSDYSFNYRNSINSFARTLSKIPIDVTDPSNILESFLEIDDKAYVRYKDLFIKSPNTEEKFVWEIFADFLYSEESIRKIDLD